MVKIIVGDFMNSVNKTLYIPLYGKSYVSEKGIILNDKKAQEIWAKEGFKLKGKSKSKWLAYYMGIRSAVFDEWVKNQMDICADGVVIHIGCGLDSRVERVGTNNHKWYDVDFPDVINERKLYYRENEYYTMLEGDARNCSWLAEIPKNSNAIIVMEGISMYLTESELKGLINSLKNHFSSINMLMDCYTELSAKISKHRNPINDVGVTEVYGFDDPKAFEVDDFTFIQEHNMTPDKYVNQLKGMEKLIFKKLYAGNLSKKMYRLYEFKR